MCDCETVGGLFTVGPTQKGDVLTSTNLSRKIIRLTGSECLVSPSEDRDIKGHLFVKLFLSLD